MSEKKQAPRRQVVQINRSGAWGKTRYEHVLSCGHRDFRPRVSRTKSISCVWCLREEKKQLEMIALAKPSTTPDDYDAKFLDIQNNAGKLKAKISHILQIPIEQVDVNTVDRNGVLEISSATAFISTAEVRRLLES